MTTRIMTSRNLVAVIFTLTAIGATSSASAQGRQAGSAAQGRQAGPSDFWSLVPAFATSCYRDDDFFDKIEAARTALAAEIETQGNINRAAREKFDNMDGMERAQRLQAFMMKNPQEAMKMMQAEQAAGTSGQAILAEVTEASTRLAAELKPLESSFRASSEQARKPVIARQDALIKAKTIPIGETATPAFTNAADHAQYVQLIAEENAAFEQACAAYFGPNGSFHKWASSYRTEVMDKEAVAGDASDAVMVMQIQAMDLPTGAYRSTLPMEKANDFLRRVREIWAIRPSKTQPTISLVRR